ncbi:cucumisin-like isoform X2 [Lotus japonicus]|uniref:cucumisin-like isoform X2 n=1 Tax=Lotus japonicus TaxID=34305 RepID=UPI00258C094F|nr:cucumisin-like isoform X2 [Lotus japonicus]
MVSLRPCLFILIFTLTITDTYSSNGRKTYIVYMGDHPKGMDPASSPSLHMAMAQKVIGSNSEPRSILHSYKSFNGFVMKLTEEEKERMAEMDEVVSVIPDSKYILHTTKSWDFIGFPQQVTRASMESDIIVGVVDTGIWPESKSFSDEGFGPPPKKWKGSCHNFTCNNKLIGAKYFNIDGSYRKKDIKSPRDPNGHGTHTSSTVAGNLVTASLLGYASGTARGGVPSARVAMYKACWVSGCRQADTLAALDAAIDDGVDVLSLSIGLGGLEYPAYFQTGTNIGSFHAMKRGIFVANSAGNSGPYFYTMTNYPPWMLSVAASTFDRKFVTKVRLGNGVVYEGSTINTFDLKNKMFPLISAGDIPNTAGGFNGSISRYCSENSVDKNAVKGKIVVCDNSVNPEKVGVFNGAAGVIFGAIGPKDLPSIFALPATFLSQGKLRNVQLYIESTRNATATILKSDEVKNTLSPYVAGFSSRGPNPITPNILKPDIAAPGVSVLAAWSPLNSISEFEGDKRKLSYNAICGTSMACPHAAAAAAYVKSFHPNWSPAMIKSALMTTATPMSSALNPEAEFAYGAGQINPVKAVNPGLVYDITEADYIQFLCGDGYTDKMLQPLTHENVSCHGKAQKRAAYNLNLPSFAIYHGNVGVFPRVFRRTVTNVGSAKSTYKATVITPSLLDIQVKPDVLSFTSIGQEKSFSVVIEGALTVKLISATLIWDDGNFQVRSPIVVYGDLPEPPDM